MQQLSRVNKFYVALLLLLFATSGLLVYLYSDAGHSPASRSRLPPTRPLGPSQPASTQNPQVVRTASVTTSPDPINNQDQALVAIKAVAGELRELKKKRLDASRIISDADRTCGLLLSPVSETDLNKVRESIRSLESRLTSEVKPFTSHYVTYFQKELLTFSQHSLVTITLDSDGFASWTTSSMNSPLHISIDTYGYCTVNQNAIDDSFEESSSQYSPEFSKEFGPYLPPKIKQTMELAARTSHH